MVREPCSWILASKIDPQEMEKDSEESFFPHKCVCVCVCVQVQVGGWRSERVGVKEFSEMSLPWIF